MIDAEIRREIRMEVERHANTILHGRAGSNTVEGEDIDEMFPGMPTQEKRPVMHPYGFASRAPRGILAIIGRIGAHFGNRFILGHRDSGRPMGLQEGEAAIYNKFGHQMQFQKEQIVVTHSTGSTITMDKEGSVVVSSKDGNYIFMNAKKGELSLVSKDGNVLTMNKDGFFVADGSGKNIIVLDTKTGKAQVTADKAVVVQAPNCTIQGGNVNLGNNAAFGAAIADFLELYLDSHTHNIITPIPGNPTSPPTVPSSAWNANPAQSFKSLFVKMRSNIV